MNDFFTKSTTYKPKHTPIFNLNNEQKEAQLGVRIKELEGQVSILERIRDEKDSIEGQLTTQRNLNTKHFETVQTLDKQVSDLTMELQDKQRILSVSDALKQDNDRLVTEHGEAVHTLSNMRMDMVGTEKELNRLRNNAFTLESNNRSMMNAAQQKDELLRELTQALGALKYQHEGLTSSSNALAKQYEDVSETRQKLDVMNVKLRGEVVVLQKQQERAVAQEKMHLETNTQAIEKRIRGESSKKFKN